MTTNYQQKLSVYITITNQLKYNLNKARSLDGTVTQSQATDDDLIIVLANIYTNNCLLLYLSYYWFRCRSKFLYRCLM